MAVETKVVPTNRLPVAQAAQPVENRRYECGGSVYERGRVKQKAQKLPEPFDLIGLDLWNVLPFHPVTPSHGDAQLHKAYLASLKVIAGRYAEGSKMFKDAVQTNIEIRTDERNAPRGRELALAKYRELEPLLPVLRADSPTLLTWETMAQPTPVIHELFRNDLWQQCCQMAARFVQSLDWMYEHKFFGLQQQHPNKPTVFRYEFYRDVVIQQDVQAQVTATERSEVVREEFRIGDFNDERNYWQEVHTHYHKAKRDYLVSRAFRKARHEHQLYDAQASPWNVKIPTPPAIKRFIELIPRWLRDKYVRVIHGEMVLERVIEMDLGEPQTWAECDEEDVKVREEIRSGRLWSPAVAIGPYTLTGWSNRDL